MSQGQQRDEFPHMSVAESLGLIYFLSLAYSTCLIVFSRWRFGTQAFGTHALVSVLIFFFGTACTGSLSIGGMGILWLLMLIVHRLATWRAWSRNERVHSEYAGYCWILTWSYGSERRAREMEPAVWVLVGIPLGVISPYLMGFVWGGAVALAIRTIIEDQAFQNRIRNMMDAEIEQEVLIEEWQRRRGDQG